MEAITIKAQKREVGKQAARQVRREGNVPCVLYGSHTEPVSFQVPELALKPLIFTSEMHLVRVELGSDAWECIMKDVDFHPVTDRPIHADFQVLQSGEKVRITVPVQYHGTPTGQKEGGDTQFLLHELQVLCYPKDIPAHIDVEIAHLQIGDAIHVSDLDVPGVEFEAEGGRTLVTVVPPRLEEVEEPEPAVELDEAEIVHTAEEEGGEKLGEA